MRARVMTSIRHTRGFGAEHYTPTPTAEIDICLNCPLPECKKDKCDRLKAEKERLKREKEQQA